MRHYHRVYSYLDEYFEALKSLQELSGSNGSHLGRCIQDGGGYGGMNFHSMVPARIEFTPSEQLPRLRKTQNALKCLSAHNYKLYMAVALSYTEIDGHRAGRDACAAAMDLSLSGYKNYMSRALDWLDGRLSVEDAPVDIEAMKFACG